MANQSFSHGKHSNFYDNSRNNSLSFTLLTRHKIRKTITKNSLKFYDTSMFIVNKAWQIHYKTILTSFYCEKKNWRTK